MYKHITTLSVPKRRQRILAFSDLQFDENFSERRLQYIFNGLRSAIKENKIDYLFFLGDLINSLNLLETPTAYQHLLRFLQSLTKLAPLIIVPGNHDVFYYRNSRHCLNNRLYSQYCADLSNIPNLYLLSTDDKTNHHIFDDGKIRVLGLSLPYDYYFKHGSIKSTIIKNQDKFDQLIQYYLPELLSGKDRDYYLLSHSPAYFNQQMYDPQIISLAGHIHNGSLPPILDQLTRFSERGLIGPGFARQGIVTNHYELFPKNARLRPTAERPWLTIRPVTYFSDHILKWLNYVYPSLSYTIIREDPRSQNLHFSETYRFKR